MPRTCLTLVLLVASASMTFAQESKFTLSASAMFGQTWLGSQDIRRGGLYSIGYSKSEPRLHAWGYDAELAAEAYYMVTKGGAIFLAGPNTSHHYGLLLVGRYFQRKSTFTNGFFEAGWGMQYSDRLTHDVDSKWNSTPMIGAGFIVPNGRYDLVFSARYFHISNAGTSGGNEGLNFYQLQIGVRF